MLNANYTLILVVELCAHFFAHFFVHIFLCCKVSELQLCQIASKSNIGSTCAPGNMNLNKGMKTMRLTMSCCSRAYIACTKQKS